MTGQVHTFKYKIENKCEVDVEVILDNDQPLSVDEVQDLVQEMSEELYYSIVNISENS